MSRSSPNALLCALILCAGLPANAAPPQNAENTATISRVGILDRGSNVEIEIAASQQVTPQVQVLTGPDRVVIDFPGAVPGADVRPLVVNRGDVKAVRVGLFKSNPPVTRVVLDLTAPQRYQLFPSGNTVTVKFGSPGSAAGPNVISASSEFICPVVAGNPQISLAAQNAPAHELSARVSFQNGLLSVRADKTTLAQVLFEVHRQTGADIAVPADAEHEQVVIDLGPAPAREVLAALLNGTHYNFILLGYDGDAGGVQRVILSSKSGGLTTESYVLDQTTLPQHGPQYVRGRASAGRGQLPPMSAQSLCDLRRESLAASAVSNTAGHASDASYQNRCSGRACDMVFFLPGRR
jgi:AMIN domain-containing protein